MRATDDCIRDVGRDALRNTSPSHEFISDECPDSPPDGLT
jgi:hypothetical protein